MYTNPNDHSSLCYISIKEWEEIIKLNFENSNESDEISGYFLSLLRDDRIDLFCRMWPLYSVKLFVNGKRSCTWYLLQGFFKRCTIDDKAALDTWSEGVEIFNDDISLLINIAKVEEPEKSLITYEKIFSLGDFSNDNIIIYIEHLFDLYSADVASAKVLEFYTQYKEFSFVYNSLKKVSSLGEFSGQSQIDELLFYLDKEVIRNPLYWASIIASMMLENKRYKEAIILTKRFLANNKENIDLNTIWSIANFNIGKEVLAVENLRTLLSSPRLNIADKEIVNNVLTNLTKE